MTKNEVGLFFGVNAPGEIPLTLSIDHNCFQDNVRQLGRCLCQEYNMSETPHTWDDGRAGNFWSDYNGTDVDGDGIGDTPYIVDALNQDRFPLMESPTSPPTVASGIPAYAVVLATVAIMASVAVAFWRVKRKIEKTR